MRFFKLIATLLVLGLIALFIQQNLLVLTAPLSFKLSFYIAEPLLGTIEVYTLMLVSAAIGLLVGLLLMLKPYTNLRRRLAHEREERLSEKTEQEGSLAA